MEYANHLKEYAPAWSASQVDEEVARIRKAAEARNHNTEVYKFCYSAIDLTTLSCNDSVKSVTEFARKAAEFYQKYPHIPNVASICIYPSFVETVGLAVDGTPMKITSVGGGFPAAWPGSHTAPSGWADLPRSERWGHWGRRPRAPCSAR